MDVVKNILGQEKSESKVGVCALCGRKGRVWRVFGGVEYRCDECEERYG